LDELPNDPILKLGRKVNQDISAQDHFKAGEGFVADEVVSEEADVLEELGVKDEFVAFFTGVFGEGDVGQDLLEVFHVEPFMAEGVSGFGGNLEGFWVNVGSVDLAAGVKPHFREEDG
jgi:hypothetical protein